MSAERDGAARVEPDFQVRWLRPGTAVIELFGEHDLSCKETLRDLFSRLVQETELLVVDLSQATFVDSTVLNALVRAQRKAEQRGCRLRLQLGSAAIVRKVFEVSGLLDFFDCAPTREQALKP